MRACSKGNDALVRSWRAGRWATLVLCGGYRRAELAAWRRAYAVERVERLEAGFFCDAYGGVAIDMLGGPVWAFHLGAERALPPPPSGPPPRAAAGRRRRPASGSAR